MEHWTRLVFPNFLKLVKLSLNISKLSEMPPPKKYVKQVCEYRERNWEVFSFHSLDNPCFFLVPLNPVAENSRPTQCVSGRVGFVAVTFDEKMGHPKNLGQFVFKMPRRFQMKHQMSSGRFGWSRTDFWVGVFALRRWLPIIYRCWSNISWGKLLLQVSGVKWWVGRSSFPSWMDFESRVFELRKRKA